MEHCHRLSHCHLPCLVYHGRLLTQRAVTTQRVALSKSVVRSGGLLARARLPLSDLNHSLDDRLVVADLLERRPDLIQWFREVDQGFNVDDPLFQQ